MIQLLPLLLRGLDLPESDIRASIIDTLYASATVGGSEQKIITEHASTLVSAMLKNCLVEHMPSHVSDHFFLDYSLFDDDGITARTNSCASLSRANSDSGAV